jgi:DNA replication and repair protein RecF
MALADYAHIIWLTPAMDGLFTGPAGDRRRFLDRMISAQNRTYRLMLGRYERAMRQRNRLLSDGSLDGGLLDGIEVQMAEAGTALAACRREAVGQLDAHLHHRLNADCGGPFPIARLALQGRLEEQLGDTHALDVEDSYARLLRDLRAKDRAAARTLEGPHLTDLLVTHAAKAMPARHCSTGEQKALLINLILAQAELSASRRSGAVPILLLDEIAAHLDAERRTALFRILVAMGTQAWLTGTDAAPFFPLKSSAIFAEIRGGRVLVEGRSVL